MTAKQPKRYTTVEASKLTNIPENTIRSWMSREPGQFEMGRHYIVEESGRKMWTEVGIEFLKTRTDDHVEAENLDAMLDPLLDAAATRYAYRFWEELPARVLYKIQQMRTNPTEDEKLRMEESVKKTLSVGTFELLPSYIRGLPDAEN
jgi:hypothetical protein